MFRVLAPLNLDCYKWGHRKQYSPHTEVVYSTWTPRKSRMSGVDKVVFFGLQYFIKDYLIDSFNETFFKRPKNEVIVEIKECMKNYLGDEDTSHWEELHDLGYLPLKICALPEGTLTPIRVPMFTIENTLPQFYWLTNFIETILSTMIWKPMTSATIALEYRKILDKWAKKTCDNSSHVDYQGHDFSYRGMCGIDGGISSGAGHLLSFKGTDTIPAILWLEKYYNADIEKEKNGVSIPACYDKETQILTDNGWKYFKDLKKGVDKVAQYHEDGSIDFVVPLDYFEDYYNGDLISFSVGKSNYVDISVTPNHRMVRKHKETGKVGFVLADSNKYKERLGFSHRNNYIISGKVKGNKTFSSIDKLRIAFQADGAYPSHKEDYNGERNKGFPIRFSLKKKRKAERIREICRDLGIKCNESFYEKTGYYSFWIVSPVKMYKDFSWIDLSKVSYDYCRNFINELQFWDGTMKQERLNCIGYSSINKDCVDMVQCIASLCGCKTKYSCYIDKRENRKPIHNVIICFDKEVISGAGTKKTKIKYDDYVYCVSVPSKMIIVRRNNVVLVCGNTEHSVAQTNIIELQELIDKGEIAKDNDWDSRKYAELLYFERLLNVYKTGVFSYVSDTYNLWEVIRDILPALKDKIMNREGRVVIRPDSGDPCDILCGYNTKTYYDDIANKEKHCKLAEGDYAEQINKGIIELLWDIFGGTINSKGYKVLDTHIGCIYGDAITLERAEEICKRLESKGFASSNVVFGIGSYTYNMNTRDTFGFALKTTYAVVNGKELLLYKDPYTDDGTKKSQKGLVVVYKDENGKIQYKDELNREQKNNENYHDLLQPVFLDGKLLRETSLSEIRERIKQ